MSNRSPLHARIQTQAAHCSAVDFFNALHTSELPGAVNVDWPAYRERVFSSGQTVSMFVAQGLSADGSCQSVVDQAVIDRLVTGLPECSTATGGYCRARSRLPIALIEQITRASAQRIADQTPDAWHEAGRRTHIVDGTTLTLPDTPDNQARYPQPRSQKPGLGFPICRLVATFNLANGALVDAAIGRYRGKGAHEQTLLRELLDHYAPGDIVLGDALFGTYFPLAELGQRGVDAVFEQHGARQRSTDFRRGRRLGYRDHLVTLTKPKKRPDWMSQCAYEAAPDHITIRELKAGGKVLITTLSHASRWPKQAIRRLYSRRWDVEVNLRHIKGTLNMDTLRCKTPDMAEKEIWVHLLGYNLIRWLMVDSARYADVLPRQLSFKHAVQLWHRWPSRARTDLSINQLLELMAQPRVANRPGRVEPRAVKRRPKPYGLLSVSRAEARDFIRKNGHPNRKAGESFKSRHKAA